MNWSSFKLNKIVADNILNKNKDEESKCLLSSNDEGHLNV